MEVAYIISPKALIKKVGDALEVRSEGRKMDQIPLAELKSMIILGNAQMSSQVLKHLMILGVNIFYMNHAGQIIGTVFSNNSGNIILRIAQYVSWQDPNFRLDFARRMITKKLEGQIGILKAALSKNKTDKSQLLSAMKRIDQMKSKLGKGETLMDIMGLEGRAAKVYFSCFSMMLNGYAYTGRQRRPAFDPINALLNYAYAFLRNELLTRLYSYGFEVELGMIHGVRYGRESLALDMMEPYRPILADNFVIHLLNDKILLLEHFTTEEDGCRLTKEGVSLFCQEYHRMMEEEPDQTNWKRRLTEAVKEVRSDLLNQGNKVRNTQGNKLEGNEGYDTIKRENTKKRDIMLTKMKK